MRALNTVLCILFFLLVAGCGSIHTVPIRVIDSSQAMPISGTTVEVERRSLHFMSLRAKPDFPRIQSEVTDDDGMVWVKLIDGDNFAISAKHPDYDRAPVIVMHAVKPSRDRHRPYMTILLDRTDVD